MALFKCKMCGGELEIKDGVTVAVCDYCGTQQTLPTAKDEVVQNLFNRANTLRLKCEFDKAEQIYEKILHENDAEPEAHWGLVLCKYGIEYVEDPRTYKRVPTCHRTSYDAVLTDADYLAAVQYADIYQRKIYEEEAKVIDRLQKDILAIVKDETPFDVFICYKETDESGKRTVDSTIANQIYYQLTQEGMKVFYAAITLEDKLGKEYEPYIFAALNSAKVMLVVGTKPQYFSAVWVKNEWNRFLKLMKSDRSKLLIPCYRDMDPYELPDEFSHLQAQDMSKIGFINDIVRGIQKVIKKDEPKVTVVKETVVTGGNGNTAPLLKRAFMFLEDGDWNSANEYCEKVLDNDPENAQAYLGKLMAELRVRKQEGLRNCAEPFDGRNNYQKAVRFADSSLKAALTGYVAYIKERNDSARLEKTYNDAVSKMRDTMSKMCTATTESNYLDAAKLFETIRTYKDSAELAQQCREKAQAAKEKVEEDRKNMLLSEAKKLMNGTIQDLKKAISKLENISDWKDASACIETCRTRIRRKEEEQEVKRKDGILSEAKKLMSGSIQDINNAITKFRSISGWKDADTLAEECQKKIEAIHAEEKRSEAIRKIMTIAAALVVVGVIVFVIVLNTVIVPNNKYDAAMAKLDAGNFVEAYEELIALKGHKDSAEKAESIYEQYKIEKLKSAEIGDEVYLGTYEQDNKTSNGNEKIKWTVLDIKDGKALVISKSVLDAKAYNNETDRNSLDKVTWSECSLRTWLNEDFYNAAFSVEEQALISTETVLPDSNPQYPQYDTSGGKETEDKVFVLSVTEAENYFSSNSARKCKATKFAEKNGVHNTASEKGCAWWLRTPGAYAGEVMEVLPSGSMDYYGANAGFSLVGVRPAMWIDLSLIQ